MIQRYTVVDDVKVISVAQLMNEEPDLTKKINIK